jgi:histidine triad (HIT) family protein
MTLFEKIIAREIPADVVYEDAKVLAFRDINPKAPVHVLIIPKRAIPRIGEVQESDAEQLGALLLCVPKVAQILGVTETGYRLIINNGKDGGETVPHLHCHLMGGRPMAWPPG